MYSLFYLLITLIKNNSSDDNKFKRINVKKIVSLNEVINKPINEVTFVVDEGTLERLKKIKFYGNESFSDKVLSGQMMVKASRSFNPVSYTHLTLPTNREV